MSALTFSPTGEDAITRAIDIQVDDAEILDPLKPAFDEFYEITRTAKEIIDSGYKRVALQFPDELLRDSVSVYRKLKHAIGELGGVGVELYVLADTSYGSCCVDEVAAQHVDADAMVHFGHACMSQTYRLPVIYVFGRKMIDVDDCVQQLLQILNLNMQQHPAPSVGNQKTVIFRHAVGYTHRADEIVRLLRQAVEPSAVTITYSHVALALRPTVSGGESLDASATTSSDDQNGIILYVGRESLTLTNLLMTHASWEVYSYHPVTRTTRLESERTNKLLMRRYAAMQKARDADVFGILVGTLGIAHYLPLIAHIRNIMSRKRKKCYTISVGKLNPAKLANFMEIECFVIVACPENSIVESKEFFKPIVTPYELEVAFQPEQSWTGRYVLDFGKLLTEGKEKLSDIEDLDGDKPVFSLVTGTYRHPKQFGESSRAEEPITSAVILRNSENAIMATSESAAGQYLQSRTFQGLEPRIGEEAPSVLEQGRSGIARDYQGG